MKDEIAEIILIATACITIFFLFDASIAEKIALSALFIVAVYSLERRVGRIFEKADVWSKIDKKRFWVLALVILFSGLVLIWYMSIFVPGLGMPIEVLMFWFFLIIVVVLHKSFESEMENKKKPKHK